MGFSFKTVSNQNLASLVWLKSEPSLEWLLPLWAEPKLQSRGCLKPGARSRSDLRIIFFPLKFHFFLSSSLSYIPNIQTTAKMYYCFLPNVSTAWLFLVAHISLHLLSWCLAFLTSNCFSFSPFPAPSCASLFYIPSVHAKHCSYGRYPPYWPWYPSPAPWILSLVTLIPLHQIHTIFPSGCLELLLPLASLFFCCIDHQSAPQQPNFTLPSLSFVAQIIGKFYVCFCFGLLNRCRTRQAQHLFS